MFKSYFTTQFRFLVKTWRYSLVATFGMSVGIAIVIIGGLYLHQEWGYDKGFADHAHIYRIETTNKVGKVSLLTPDQVTTHFKQNWPEITTLTRFNETPLFQTLLKTSDGKMTYLKHVYNVDSSFFNVFNFPFVYGRAATALSSPDAIILSKLLSDKLFKGLDPTGQHVSTGDGQLYTVTGVIDNDAFPTHLFIEAIKLSPVPELGSPPVSAFSYAYVKLGRAANLPQLDSNLARSYRQQMSATYKTAIQGSVALRPLQDIHLYSHTQQELSKAGNPTAAWLVLCLIVFMWLVSAINFVNFNLSIFPSRLKEIVVRRVMGSSVWGIIQQYYLETAMKCLLSILLALLLVVLCLPFTRRFVDVHSLFGQSGLTLLSEVLGVLVLFTLVTGVYPLLNAAIFSPAKSLKGSFLNSPKGSLLRDGLSILQFAITSIFIIGFAVISTQLTYLRNTDLGYKSEHILVINPSQPGTLQDYPFIKTSLERLPGVQSVSHSSTIGHSNDRTIIPINVNGTKYPVQYLCIDTSYFDVMSARFVAGKSFYAATADSLEELVVNQQLAEILGIKDFHTIPSIDFLGKKCNIIGVVANMNFYGFEDQAGPMIFTTGRHTLTPFILVKANAPAISSTIKGMSNLWTTIEPGYPINYQFLDESFQQLYDSYATFATLFEFLTVCALLIAFIGLFGLTALVTRQRTKEIAIRQIVGASVLQILALLNAKFLKLCLLANALAWPIAYLLCQRWLNNFAFRIALPVWPFFLAAIASITLTVLTVCFQTFAFASRSQVAHLHTD